ncbi:hypothetical protein [Spiroplasma endosymbiont of Othius punctulatus]|uniref:hypothetical protein n=1 Tax=Spiroplasma endosymbiont of Othius punctulatus TaxID=3066289 RepID=UPI0030D0564A
MKKLLSILAISTIVIVPSITLVSCFNETNPKYFRFNSEDPIASIMNATRREKFVIYRGDFVSKDNEGAGKTKVELSAVEEAIYFQISNSFTPREDAVAAFNFLTTDGKHGYKLSNGLDGDINLVEDENGFFVLDEINTINIEIKDGKSFYGLNKDVKKETYFTDGLTNDKKLVSPINIPVYLAMNWKAIDTMTDPEEIKMWTSNISSQIYELIISQSIYNIKNHEPKVWREKFETLNSSEVLFKGEKPEEETVKYFQKENVDSITSFLTMQKSIDEKNDIVEAIMDAMWTNESGGSWNVYVDVKTNLFNIEVVDKTSVTEDKIEKGFVSDIRIIL